MKRLLLPLLAALAIPTAVNATTEIEPEPKSQILNNPYERLGKEAHIQEICQKAKRKQFWIFTHKLENYLKKLVFNIMLIT